MSTDERKEGRKISLSLDSEVIGMNSEPNLTKNMIVASKDLKVRPPWVLVESKTYEGTYRPLFLFSSITSLLLFDFVLFDFKIYF